MHAADIRADFLERLFVELVRWGFHISSSAARIAQVAVNIGQRIWPAALWSGDYWLLLPSSKPNSFSMYTPRLHAMEDAHSRKISQEQLIWNRVETFLHIQSNPN
jgi:hypothetical protein